MRSHKALTLVSLERLNVQNITSVVLPLICSLKSANDFLCCQLICDCFSQLINSVFGLKNVRKWRKDVDNFFPKSKITSLNIVFCPQPDDIQLQP